MSNIIKYALDKIRNGDARELQRTVLSKINLHKMDVEKSNDLLAIFLKTSNDFDQGECTRAIVDWWARSNPGNDKLSINTLMFMSRKFSMDILRHMVRNFPEKDFFDYADEFINADGSPETLDGFERMVDVFHPDQESIQYMMDRLKEQEDRESIPNVNLKNYVSELFSKLSDPLPKPKWVKDFTNSEILPFDDEIEVPKLPEAVFELPDPELAADLLTRGLKGQGFNEKDLQGIRVPIAEQYRKATDKEKAKLLQDVFVAKAGLELGRLDNLFRIFGPVNPLPNSDLSDDHPCFKYGGCRMLTCLHHTNWDPDFGVIDEDLADHYDPEISGIEWFKESCDYCHGKILKKCYAIRRPMIGGGWKYCYCSFNCLKDDIGDPTPYDLPLIERIEKKTNEIGIQDRNYKEK